jgi:K+-transporting ATPase ATPase A chain
MAKVFNGERNLLSPMLRPVENLVYRLSGIDPTFEDNWKQYAWAMLVFNLLGFLMLFLLQGILPLNPAGLSNVEIRSRRAVSAVSTAPAYRLIGGKPR